MRSHQMKKIQESEAAWNRVRTEAWNPESMDRPPYTGVPRIQLIHRHSFQPGVFWEVSERADEWLLYRANVLENRAREPVLVTGYEPLAISSATLSSYFKRLTQTSVVIAPYLQSVGGLDGELFRLVLVGNLSSRVQFDWWSDPPPQWLPIVEIVNEMLTTFQAATRGDHVA